MQTLFWSILNILPNVIKIDPCNFELHCFKVGAFFETQCRCQALLYCRLIVLEILQSRDYFEVLVLVLLSVLILVCILLFNRLVKLKLGRHFPMKINWIICYNLNTALCTIVHRAVKTYTKFTCDQVIWFW